MGVTSDAISVFYQTASDVINVKYNLTSGKGTTTGSFTKDGNENDDLSDATMLAAVYPYTQGANCDANTAEITGMTAAVDKYPMAYKGNSQQISFKNAGALVQVNTANIPDGFEKLVLSSATKGIAGAYTITFNNQDEPFAKKNNDDTKSLEISTGNLTNQTIYFPLFIDNYTDLTVKAINTTNSTEYSLVAPKALATSRNNIYYTSALAIATNTNELKQIIASTASDITIIVDESIKDIELPNSTDKTITLVINNNTDDISVVAQSGKTVSGKINLVFATRTVTDKTLTINLPDATVEASGNATFANIYSTTASNTLILGAGITATKVTVNQGNVQVNTGATVSEFENSSAEEIVIIDNGGTIPADNTGFTKRTYAEHELIKAINDNTVNTHTLTGNVTLSEILTINRDFVLDGNGYTLTSTISGSTGRAINVGKSGSGDLNVTIKNLTIETSGQRAINLIQGSHNVTIENVTATSDNYTVNVAASAPGSTVTINNSTLTGKNTINIGGNNTKMTVSESTLTTIDNNADEGYSTITVGSYDVGSSDFLSESEVSVQNCTFNINGDDTNYTYNVSYASSLNEVEIISSNPAQLNIEDVKAISPQGNEYYYSASTLDELIEKANGNTIILVGNVTVTQNITCNKNLTLDLNDNTMTIDTDADQGDWGLIFEGNTIIKNGKIVTKSRYPLLFNNETEKKEVTITDIVIEGNRNEGTNGNVGTIIMGGNAIVTINDDVNISATNYSCIIEGTSNDAMSNSAEINIYGGNFSLINKSSDQATVLGAGFGSTINVNNGVFDGTEANFVASAYPSGGIINIGNGTFKGALKEYTSNGKTIEISIKGGTFTVDPSEYLFTGYSATENNGIWTVSATAN